MSAESVPDDLVIIEEVPIRKPRPTGWIVFGILIAVVALLLGVNAAKKSRERSQPATPTPIPPL